ncbi:MAG: hypothetical protein H6622_11610 [Halobacteriovoraceae bacterium]|nr:hypothetical protein [Halobacteriovoraceae bacterium]
MNNQNTRAEYLSDPYMYYFNILGHEVNAGIDSPWAEVYGLSIIFSFLQSNGQNESPENQIYSIHNLINVNWN